MSKRGKLELRKPLHAHPELQPRQRLEKLVAIMEYANAPSSFPVSVSVAADEIRARALIWDTDRNQNHVHKVPRAGRVWKRLVLISKRCARTSNEAADARTVLIIKGDPVLNKHTQTGAPAAVGACVSRGYKRNVFSGCPNR